MAKKIAFIWYWDRAEEIFPHWRDGLRAAIEIIGKKYKVDWILGKKEPEKQYDFILVWSDDQAPILLKDYGCPMGLCYGSTFPPLLENLRKLKCVFVENSISYELIRRDGIRTIKAFGTDTDFFSPDKTKKKYEYFFPATFNPWKLQGSIASLGSRLLCAGEVQHDGYGELQACLDNKVHVIPEYTPSKKIRDLYRQSEKVIIPAKFGSERTVLEAMSMDIIPEVNIENDRACTYLDEFEKSGIKSPREFVKKYYSAEKYAEQLLKGILE